MSELLSGHENSGPGKTDGRTNERTVGKSDFNKPTFRDIKIKKIIRERN